MTVTLELSADGCLAGFSATGHAGGAPMGANIACAAATTLLRTAARVLSSSDEFAVQGSADAPGELCVRVSSRRKTGTERLRGITDFLLRGLRDLEAEFPREIAIVMK